jgi:ADP-heptose:LPS heptosyltransferase
MSVTSDVLAFLSHSHRRIGAASLQGRNNFTGYLYHLRVPLFWDTHSLVHQTQRNLAIASSLGLEEVSQELDIGLTSEERAEGKRLLNEKIDGHKFVIGFHPGAAKIPNRWDALLFAELANRCAEILGAFLVITAGPDDDEPLREMTMNMPNDHLLLHNEPIRLVASVLANCDVYVSNDTGMMHVAAAAGTPTLSLFGPTDPLQWAPPGNGHRFILGKDNNVNNIPVEKVWRVLQAMLRARAESRQWAE